MVSTRLMQNILAGMMMVLWIGQKANTFLIQPQTLIQYIQVLLSHPLLMVAVLPYFLIKMKRFVKL